MEFLFVPRLSRVFLSGLRSQAGPCSTIHPMNYNALSLSEQHGTPILSESQQSLLFQDKTEYLFCDS